MRPFEIDWWPKRIVSGRGCVERLPELVTALGRSRALVLCGRSIAENGSLERIAERLGPYFVGAFTHVEMHAPLATLERAAAQAREASADLIVSVGGGSAIDSGKGVRLMHRVGREFLAYALQPGSGGGHSTIESMPDLSLAHIAVPTTTGSGSEVTPTCGFRDPAVGHKRIFRHERLIPDAAVLDPEMTVGTPAALTACSGMTAVARCVEALYSGRRNPFRSALALHGLRLLAHSLSQTIAAPQDLGARADCLVASAMSAVAANVNTSAVHAVGHVVGGRYGLQHGVPHAILLASGMRAMLSTVGDEQKSLLWTLGENPEGMTADEAGRRSSELIAKFVSALPLPQRLRDVGVEREALADLAEHASCDPILLNSGANLSAERIRAMLEQAY